MNDRTGASNLIAAAAIVLMTASMAAQESTMQVRGMVVDVRGFGVPAAEVWVGEDSDLRHDRVLARTFTDGEGVFLLSRAPKRDDLRLHVRAEGLVSHPLTLNTERCNWRVTMRETLPVRGTLRDSRGNPVRKALVWTPAQDPRCEATTDDEGHFELAAVGLGPNTLCAWVPGEGGVEQRLRVGGDDDVVLTAQPKQANEVRVIVDGYPDSAAEPIELLVTGAFGMTPPLPDARMPTTRWQWGNDFVLGGLHVEPRAPGFVFVPQQENDDDRRMHRTHFRAYPVGKAPTTRYTVRMSSENGHPVQRARFELSAPGHRNPVFATSDDTGVVAFDSTLLANDTAELRSADPRWVVEYPWDLPSEAPAPTVDTAMHVLQLGGDQPFHIKVLASSRAAGRVLRADGQPARFESVSLHYIPSADDTTTWHMRTITTDANGAFAFEALPPFRQQLVVKCAFTTSEPFSIAEAGTRVQLGDQHLRVPTSVEGVIRDADGKPVAGVPLVVVSGEERQFVTTDRQGRYRVADIAPGLVRLTAPNWSGPSTLAAAVLVEAGSAATIDGQR